MRFHADRLYGDKSGFLHVGYNQNFSVAVTDPDIPFGLRVYENGSMMLPRRAFLQTVSFKSSGKVLSLSSRVKNPEIMLNSIQSSRCDDNSIFNLFFINSFVGNRNA